MAKSGAVKLITPKQCADMLSVFPATLRRYAKSYIRGGTSIKRTNSLLGTIIVDEPEMLPLAATMSHAELVSNVEQIDLF